MSRPYKPKDFPALSPYLCVRNMEESLAYYQKVFGFTVHGEPMRQNGKLMHAELQLGDALIMMGAEDACGLPNRSPRTSGVPAPLSLYVYVPDVDTFFQRAKTAGAEVMVEPIVAFYGDKNCKLKDLNGYEWYFATNVADFDATKIPQPK